MNTKLPSTSPPRLLKQDITAGFVVFLVALPLCLGIALASGATLFSGIIAVVVGGLVVSLASGSSVSVSGPTAVLAVMVGASIQALGSYRVFLLAVVLAGLIQVMLGLLRLGVLGDYVPNSVIKGMLAGVGLVIILKQIPHALGRDQDYEGDFEFFEGQDNTITDIMEAVLSASPGAILITVISLVILLGWDRLADRTMPFLRRIPPSLVVVLAAVGINQGLGVAWPAMQVTAREHLVSLPVVTSSAGFFSQFSMPDFRAIGNPKVWMSAFTLAVVGGVESLLSLEAADRLDPYRRISSTNRELAAQGLGNLVSGMIGGLPVTSGVVWTSANVYAGARTWMASFIHGVLLVAAVVLIPAFLNMTPLACLAAILIVISYELTKPSIYKAMYARGWSQFLPFIVTVIAILGTDLLVGVLVGLLVGLFFVIRQNHHEAITVVHQDHHYLIRLNKDATFVNKNELRHKLRRIPDGAHVFIDGVKALYVDRDILEVVEDYKLMAQHKGISIKIHNLE